MAERLGELEARFFDLIRAPAGVADGLRALGSSPGSLSGLVRGDETLSAEARLDIYAHMYFFRIRDVLAADFARLAALLGETGFHDLATDYLALYPSVHPSLREVGARLPALLRGTIEPVAAEPVAAPSTSRAGEFTARLRAERPWLADLAALEWAIHDVFDAADAPVRSVAELQALPPEAFAALPLRLHPAARVVRADSEIAPVYAGERAVPEGASSTILVWRAELRIFHRPVEPLEAEMLTWLERGATFGEVCERIAEEVGPEAAGTAAFQLLARWATDGILGSGPA